MVSLVHAKMLIRVKMFFFYAQLALLRAILGSLILNFYFNLKTLSFPFFLTCLAMYLLTS